MAKMSPPPVKKKISKEKGATDIEKVISSAKSKEPMAQTPPDAIKPLQLKIPEGRKNEFKAYAAMRGRSMNALFLDMFEEYKDNHH
ncbi:hypothetical protein MNBD_GAMMA01-1394 [hydrothermal vent metagenome]|uniref:Uncharacterized protein n=1 Tax=hydrothermal vent metagenome TaxID=652676 RepID=A0A3B0VUB3_9ZZZZ